MPPSRKITKIVCLNTNLSPKLYKKNFFLEKAFLTFQWTEHFIYFSYLPSRILSLLSLEYDFNVDSIKDKNKKKNIDTDSITSKFQIHDVTITPNQYTIDTDHNYIIYI